SLGKPLTLEVSRSGQIVFTQVTPKEYDEPVIENGKQTVRKVGRIGIELTPSYERQGPVPSVVTGTKYTIGYISLLGNVILHGKAKEKLGGPIAMTQMTTAAQKFGFS